MTLPVYRILPPSMDDETGMFLVSLVEEPAVETEWLMFNKEKPSFQFSVQDEDKHIVTGISIKASTPIYRRKGDEEFYVVFEKDDIPAIVEKFVRNGFNNFISLQHNDATLSNTSAVLLEHFFINKERGICPKEFENEPDGSWVTSFKILDENIWQEIKAGNLHGFSIEISAELEPSKEKYEKQKTQEELDDEELMKMIFASKSAEGAAAAEAVNAATKVVDQISIPKDNIDMNTFNEASVEYAIKEHKIVLLTYTGNDATSFRQGAVSAYGYTSAGNKALRFHEFSGASQSGTMGWKIILWSDVQEFHVVDYMGVWTAAQIGYTGEMGLDGPGYLQNAHEAPMW